MRLIKSIIFILCFVPILAEGVGRDLRYKLGGVREILQYLDGVRVVVKASSGVKERGITEEQLRTAVEVRVRRTGIRLSKDRLLPKDDPEAFWMAIEPADMSPLIVLVYGSRITLRLVQTYFLDDEDRDDILSEVSGEEPTLDFLHERLFARGSYFLLWERELNFTYETKEKLFSHLSRLVEEFIKDYRLAHPDPSMWVVWEDYAALTNPFVPTIRSASD